MAAMERSAAESSGVVVLGELEIDPTEAPEDEESETLGFEISSYPADYTVKVLVQKWVDDQLVIPDFQREYVWTMPQASRLIESFLLGLPVPQVFLYKERTSQKLLVVDGQQRLSTLAQFYDGVFRGSQVFKLRGVNERWEGRRYSDLDPADKWRLDDSVLRAIVIQQLRPDDHSSIYLVFERLNTGGTPLNPMQIRKAVFHGPPYELVDELNRDPAWRQLIGMPALDRRYKDVELVVRVLALASGWQSYTKPMKTFLTRYMLSLAKENGAQLRATRDGFRLAVNVCIAALDEKPFHVRGGRLNAAILDSFLGAVLASGATDPARVGETYAVLLADEPFRESIFFNTSDSEVVRSRFQKTLNLLSTDE